MISSLKKLQFTLLTYYSFGLFFLQEFTYSLATHINVEPQAEDEEEESS
jgi:hypothetical protein